MKAIACAIMAISIFSIVSAQAPEIDFRTTDAKGLTPPQIYQYEQSRARFFDRQAAAKGSKEETKSLVIKGNKIKTIIYNTGSISRPNVTPNSLDLVWNGLGYGYEFGPMVGCKVPKEGSAIDSIKIVSEGFDSPSDGEYGPDGTKWGWLPKLGYSASGQPEIASWGARAKVDNDLRQRPPSWPESWYNATLGRYVYPSFLGGNSTVPDEEVFYVVDDYTKQEFSYYPFLSDTTKRGLGMNLEVRTFQFSNPLAEDIIFLVYTAENSSEKHLGRVFFGMFGDPHIGGANNYADDAASFIPAREGEVFKDNRDLTIVNGVITSQRSRSLVYAWDPDNKSDISTIAPGYFGYKFLESPTNSQDGRDNDDDGLVDESPFNDKGYFIDGITHPLTEGIANPAKYKLMYGQPKPRWSGDENGNWDPNRDDVGIDGIPGTNDEGEGNGVPDQKFATDGTWLGSEPNFGMRDVNESDQIGLKSFWALVFGGNNRPKNDILMYDKISSDMDTSGVALLFPPTTGDNIFLYGCGPFDLRHGDRQRFSIALMMGQDLNDLLINSEMAQRVLEANYTMMQPPAKPHVAAVPGNGRVTLYWDSASEEGIDPLLNTKDFEGYKIYRSEDYTFSDVFTITDGYGTPLLGKALYDGRARKSAQWHHPWSDSLQTIYAGGFHPVDIPGHYVKYYMGEPTDQSGLRHQYVDSTVTNGKTYYYAVVAFDHGAYSDNLKVPPTETTALITRDAVTEAFTFDVNTIAVIPAPQTTTHDSAVTDITSGKTTIHMSGNATGTLRFQVLNENILEKNTYKISFKKAKIGTDSLLAYSILHEFPVSETIIGRDTLYVRLKYKNILKSSVQVMDAGHVVISPALISVDGDGGQLKGIQSGVLKNDASYTVTYQYFPIFNSTSTAGEDNNPVFDGIRAFVKEDVLDLDTTASGFGPIKPSNVTCKIGSSTITGGGMRIAPLDFRISFLSSLGDTTNAGDYRAPADSLLPTAGSIRVKTPFKIENVTDTSIKVTIRVLDNGKKGRWDLGDELVVVTPPPYNLVANNIMMGIFFRSLGGGSVPNIPAGTVYTAKTKKPFSANDLYSFSTNIPMSVEKPTTVVPARFSLDQNYPNPFNPITTIQYALPKAGFVEVNIFNIQGQLVRSLLKSYQQPGSYRLMWDASGSAGVPAASGVYFCQVRFNGSMLVRKLVLLK